MNYLKKPLTYLSIVALFAGAFTVTSAIADPGQGPRHHKEHAKKPHNPGMQMLKKLDLSEEQRAQVKQIMEDSKEEHKALSASLREYKKAMGELVNSADYSEQAVRSLHAQYQSVFADQAVLRASTEYKINALLTPEQQAKKAEIKEKMKQRWEKRKDRKKERKADKK